MKRNKVQSGRLKKKHVATAVAQHLAKSIAKVNASYLTDEAKACFRDAFQNKAILSHESKAEAIADPFSCFVLPKFTEGDDFLHNLKNELLDLNFFEKNNDLYKFYQSNDLKKINEPHIMALRKLLYEDFLKWLIDVTGIPLTNAVDMTCSRYEYTDVLLCHDDELDDRRIAFILYLVPPWKTTDGGTLDLFGTDANVQPTSIVRSLTPSWNTLIFFEVTPVSFHQVSEILSTEKVRLSISGWFHGPPISRPSPHVEPLPILKSAEFIEEELLRQWINPQYLSSDVQMQIQMKFQDSSEIELNDFLQEEKYQQLAAQLQNDSTSWKLIGPPNKRKYEELPEMDYPPILKEYLSVCHSEAMFLILSNLTGLTLHQLAAADNRATEDGSGESTSNGNEPSKDPDVCSEKDMEPSNSKKTFDPKCYSRIRQWKCGHYTLVHDEDTENSSFALDAILYLNCQDWKIEYGGYTSHIAKDEDEELLTVKPCANSLALVYRDPDTMKFVKYVNHKVTELSERSQKFQDIISVFYE